MSLSIPTDYKYCFNQMLTHTQLPESSTSVGLAKVPALQATQTLRPSFGAVPALQGVHLVVPAAATKPSGQEVQFSGWSRDGIVPEAQGTQLVRFSGTWPPGQREHSSLPEKFLNLPDSQGAQTSH